MNKKENGLPRAIKALAMTNKGTFVKRGKNKNRRRRETRPAADCVEQLYTMGITFGKMRLNRSIKKALTEAKPYPDKTELKSKTI